MKEAKAQLNNYRQSPRKVRLVATAIKGKKVSQAKNVLDFTVKRATNPLHKLLDSAISNAKNLGMSAENLVVKSITVDGGKILYRRLPAARGSAHPMRKRTSHVTLILEEKMQVQKGANKKGEQKQK